MSTGEMIIWMFDEDSEKYNDESVDIDFHVIDEFAKSKGYNFNLENEFYEKVI